jgi:MobA/MobL family protein
MTADGFYHCGVKGIGRATGRSVVAAAAYRAGVRLTDAITGQVADYRARGGVEEHLIVAPDNAPAWAYDLGRLFNEAQLAEPRANGRIATEIVIALPHELDAQTRRGLALSFASWPVNLHGVAAHVSLHAPDPEGDARNFHAHILLTHRMLGPDGFGEIANTRTQTRTRKGREMLEQIAGVTATPADIRAVRRQWEAAVNHAYAKAGLDIRVDHRSHKDRDIEDVPTIHLGPKATAMERRGEPSERGDFNRAIIRHNETPGPAAAAQRPEEGIPTYPAPSENAPALILARPIIATQPEMPETAVEPGQRHEMESEATPASDIVPLPAAGEPVAAPVEIAPARDAEHNNIPDQSEKGALRDFDPEWPTSRAATDALPSPEHEPTGQQIRAGPATRAGRILGAITGMFREAVKAITKRDDHKAPKPQRRRRGETEGEFRKLARNLSRHYHDMRADFRQRASITSRFLTIPLEAYARAGDYLSDTLDQLNRFDNDGDANNFDEHYDINQSYPSPGL